LHTATRQCQKISRITITLLITGLVFLLSACQDASARIQLPPTAAPISYVLIPDLLTTSQPAGNRSIATIGYVLADQTGVLLVDAVVFDAGGKPEPLETGSAPLWLGTQLPTQLQGLLRTAGSVEYASVVAHAHLLGPGSYGPNGRYHYQLTDPILQPLAAQETTIDDLLNRPAAYESRLIRMVGGLLIRESSALLVDKLGPGGIPEPKSRQIKLRAPINDQALLARLKSAPSGAVHFGQIQIEGLWRQGALTPISITIIA
jgi:hypothetical protein